jgi:hypothetical protein
VASEKTQGVRKFSIVGLRSDLDPSESSTETSSTISAGEHDMSHEEQIKMDQMKLLEDNSISDIMPEESLIQAYLKSDRTPKLHIRRSLDQFHCIGMPEKILRKLDVDQTVYKYQRRKAKEFRKKGSISDDDQVSSRDQGDISHQALTTTKKNAESRNEPAIENIIDTDSCQEMKELLRRSEREKSTPGKHFIAVVDQLWLWIIDDGKCYSDFHS